MSQEVTTAIFAPMYWGFVASIFLGGITIVQAYIYFPNQQDRQIVRLTAASMLVLDLTSSALISYSIYYYLIPHFGSLVPLQSVTPELSAECLVSTTITLISQLYFVHQLICVKRLGRGSWVIIGIITLFAILAAAGGIACVGSMYVFHHGVLSNRNSTFAILFGLAKGFAAVTDILATIAMCLFLSWSKAGIKQTNSLLDGLMQFVIHRGALVTLVQVLLLLTFYAAPRSLAWLAFHINVTKLYANTFFAMLNARSQLKDKHSNVTMSLGHLNFTDIHPAYPVGSLHTRRERFSNPIVEHVGLDRKGSQTNIDMPMITKTVVIADM